MENQVQRMAVMEHPSPMSGPGREVTLAVVDPMTASAALRPLRIPLAASDVPTRAGVAACSEAQK